ncbi:S24 family peptidase [Pararoseomonas indoligenes]|uniref:S24 family peptidase n=1 Tax=Roseomonas indoligenes TaxID=2820811 RepID=A0A940S4Q7_9PROT|nr:S24 family peptidase [Pararoseomonas indoligenes]MBP0492205.1 S24 family peptidase [Pararoseomonas indoligenes]
MVDEEPAAIRLRKLRERSGLSIQAVADKLGHDGRSTYASREDVKKAKGRFIKVEHALSYLPVFVGRGDPPITRDDVMALTGTETLPAVSAPDPMDDDDEGEPRQGYLVLREYDVAGAAGYGAFPNLSPGGEARIVGEWRVPRSMLPARYQGGTIAIVSVQGDSMVPELMPEERVMVDISQTFMGPEGIYLLVFDDSLLVKRLQRVGNGKLRLVSKNPDFEPLIVPASEVRIVGRIIGRWEWK